MWRFLAGAAAMLGLIGAGFMLVKSMAATEPPLTAQERAQVSGEPDMAPPMRFADRLAPVPSADEKTKEEKRFDRYDQDENGVVSRAEYLQTRQKAFARIDLNGDGKLSFDEYAAKAGTKFAKADADKSGVLNRREFSTTRTVPKSKPVRNCRPAPSGPVQLPSKDKADSEDA